MQDGKVLLAIPPFMERLQPQLSKQERLSYQSNSHSAEVMKQTERYGLLDHIKWIDEIIYEAVCR